MPSQLNLSGYGTLARRTRQQTGSEDAEIDRAILKGK
jgi:hypothetical protein